MSCRSSRLSLGGACLLLSLSFSNPVLAEQRTLSREGRPVRWKTPEVVLQLNSRTGSGPERIVALQTALQRAIERWQPECSGLSIRIGEPTPSRGAEADGINSVVVQEHEWCRAGRRREKCYDSRQFAITTVTLDRGVGLDGEIALLSADIEINGVHFDWFADRDQLLPPPVSLETLLTHELGHVLGFEDVPVDAEDPAAGIMTAEAHWGSGASSPSAAELELLCSVYPKLDSRAAVAWYLRPVNWTSAAAVALLGVFLAGRSRRLRLRSS